jgi:hypothetical protein
MLKVATFENQLCIVLPTQTATKLGATSGMEIPMLETERGVELLKCESEAEIQMSLAEEIMEDDKEVLRRLAV